MDSKASVLVFLVICCAWQVQSQSFNCTSAGRFPVSSDTSCQKYTLCIYNSTTGTYFGYDYGCPSTSVFNPNTHQCTDSSKYVCNITTTSNNSTTSNSTKTSNNSTTSNSTTPSNSTTSTNSTTPCNSPTTSNSTTSNGTTKSACTSEGYIENPLVTDCKTFIECVAFGSKYMETIRACPDGTYFNPITSDCEYYYHCPFNCGAPGRFANQEDPTCKTYYFCVLKPNGSFWRLEYACTYPSLFNPTSKICSSRYVCGK